MRTEQTYPCQTDKDPEAISDWPETAAAMALRVSPDQLDIVGTTERGEVYAFYAAEAEVYQVDNGNYAAVLIN